MNDQMAAILEAHREVVVREFVAWFFTHVPITRLIDSTPEDIVQDYLAYLRKRVAA
jgi:hypothetical protein